MASCEHSGGWCCAGCDAENDDTFDVCWQCGTDRDGKPDPTFRSEQAPGHQDAMAADVADVDLERRRRFWLRAWAGSWALLMLIRLVDAALPVTFAMKPWEQAINGLLLVTLGVAVSSPVLCLRQLLAGPGKGQSSSRTN